MFRLSFMFIALLTAGCVSLDPHYDRPAAPVPATLPGAHGESTAVVGDWQKVALLTTIGLSSKTAILSVECAEAKVAEGASLALTVKPLRWSAAGSRLSTMRG